MSWEVVSCWIESHPGLASWVQAVGSILAILVAVWIASSQKREQLRNDKRMFNRDCEYLKIVSRRAVRAARPRPAEISATDAARALIGVNSIFKQINLMGLPDACLVEPVSTIRDALQAAELAIAREPKIEQYFSSSEHAKFSKAIFLANNRILAEVDRIS